MLSLKKSNGSKLISEQLLKYMLYLLKPVESDMDKNVVFMIFHVGLGKASLTF